MVRAARVLERSLLSLYPRAVDDIAAAQRVPASPRRRPDGLRHRCVRGHYLASRAVRRGRLGCRYVDSRRRNVFLAHKLAYKI